jgi:flavin reductase (DIM6/NTAB) family NADH-FMN oxidoreductase RutF
MPKFKQADISELSFNPFTLINNEWMLVTAGDEQKNNTMTASWGGVGVLWNKNVSFIFIRPQRYTLEFIEQQDCYSLCFFDKEYKPALSFCGAKSGRDVDKVKETGLTPVYDEVAPYFAQAKLVLICRKLYGQKIDPACLIDAGIDTASYPGKDYHKMFIGAIEKVLVKED